MTSKPFGRLSVQLVTCHWPLSHSLYRRRGAGENRILPHLRMGDESQFERISQPSVSEVPWSAPRWVSVRWQMRPREHWYNSLPFHIVLFLLTVFTTLIVGTHIALNYAQRRSGFRLGRLARLLPRIVAPPGAADFRRAVFRHPALHFAGARTRPLLHLPLLSNSRHLPLLHSCSHADWNVRRLHSHQVSHRESARAF